MTDGETRTSTLRPAGITGPGGLFLIRQRLDLAGGGMTVENAPGHGTRVTLRAPAGPVSEVAAAVTVASESAAARDVAGAVDFVTKSGPPDALISAIRAAFRPDSDRESR